MRSITLVKLGMYKVELLACEPGQAGWQPSTYWEQRRD